MHIGEHKLRNNVIAAPMAGVSDLPFRDVCRAHGAGLAVSEMVTSRVDLHHSTKTKFRLNHAGEVEPRVVQIVGTDPIVLAQAAEFNVENGAQIIDINMGCPAKKVCKKAAGSALLGDEDLVEQILTSVVNAVDVPVTVKIRTGLTPKHRNGDNIAKIAEQSGVQAITVHGRTRECKFVGDVEYDTIRSIKRAVSIPVIANGDIDSPHKAKEVLDYTNADAVMIGRAAQGQPWIFDQIARYLQRGELRAKPNPRAQQQCIESHISAIHQFYGESLGVRFARKHIKWYLQRSDWQIDRTALLSLSTVESTLEQSTLLHDLIELCIEQSSDQELALSIETACKAA